MNYNNYPKTGIDNKIKIMQDVLFQHLGFENVDFYGRVQKIVNKEGKGLSPQISISNTERKEVLYDDRNAPGGSIFFVDNDEHTTTDGDRFFAKVKVVFMLNLNKVASIKNYRSDSEIQQNAIDLLKKLKAIEITAIEKGIENVLSDFNTDQIKEYDIQPYHTFSINGNLYY
ncbi:hypothetical protein [Flavobacterium crassostreae]|uniref:Uncharacterized protein n=1 Tax=Flavobacterium crassostreae TaxID=1763534 RepID=A0A1B9E7M7_9FLAO|nr:hypothetical protein [Flavobacterium crassostreae]OCB77955.1 hypothetical protein LPBF_03135 [Flavobacterium crassostreae]